MGSPSEYQKELARRIFLEGFTIGDLNARNNLPVHLEGVIVGYISHRGFTVDGEYDPRCATLQGRTAAKYLRRSREPQGALGPFLCLLRGGI